jgi:hypothetical protein
MMKRILCGALLILGLLAPAAFAHTCYVADIYGYGETWYILAYDDGTFVDDANYAGYWDYAGPVMYFQYTEDDYYDPYNFFMSGTKKAGFWQDDKYYTDYYTLKKVKIGYCVFSAMPKAKRGKTIQK